MAERHALRGQVTGSVRPRVLSLVRVLSQAYCTAGPAVPPLCAALLVGSHDFTQFSNTSPERLRRNPVKTLERIDLVQNPDQPTVLRLEVSAYHSCSTLIMLSEVAGVGRSHPTVQIQQLGNDSTCSACGNTACVQLAGL